MFSALYPHTNWFIENADIATKDIYINIMMNNYGYFHRI